MKLYYSIKYKKERTRGENEEIITIFSQNKLIIVLERRKVSYYFYLIIIC